MRNKKIQPPVYLFGLLLLSLFVNFIFPIAKIFNFPFNLLGLVLIFMGGWLNIKTDNLFKKYKTTVKPEKEASVLITEGVFQWSRHPMYLGMALILLGIAIILGSLGSFVGMIIFLVVMEKKFIFMEEKNMESKFGKKYLKYKKQVRKWI